MNPTNNQSTKEIRRDKNPVKRQSENISTSILEKMKSLELYFKLRNEGWEKSYTEFPKTTEKIDSINNNINKNINNNINTPLKASKTIRENIKLDKLDNTRVENETMRNLEIEEDAYEFNEDNYKERRYD